MSKLKEAMENYFDGRDKIFNVFDTSGWEEIEDQTKVKWINQDGYISFFDEDDVEYSWESGNKVGPTVDGVGLYYVHENGNSYYVLLTEDKSLTEEEYEEIQN